MNVLRVLLVISLFHLEIFAISKIPKYVSLYPSEKQFNLPVLPNYWAWDMPPKKMASDIGGIELGEFGNIIGETTGKKEGFLFAEIKNKGYFFIEKNGALETKAQISIYQNLKSTQTHIDKMTPSQYIETGSQYIKYLSNNIFSISKNKYVPKYLFQSKELLEIREKIEINKDENLTIFYRNSGELHLNNEGDPYVIIFVIRPSIYYWLNESEQLYLPIKLVEKIN